jgi:hypothetical protein
MSEQVAPKKAYQKPIVMDLGEVARGSGYCAAGSSPAVGYCEAGGSALEYCTAGTNAGTACTAGTGAVTACTEGSGFAFG